MFTKGINLKNEFFAKLSQILKTCLLIAFLTSISVFICTQNWTGNTSWIKFNILCAEYLKYLLIYWIN